MVVIFLNVAKDWEKNKNYVKNAIKEEQLLGLSSQNLMFYFVKKDINDWLTKNITIMFWKARGDHFLQL